MNLSKNLLLSYYLIIPICILIVLVDTLFFDLNLKLSLKNSPNEYLFFTLFFVLPHIIGSFLTLQGNEYLKEYKNKLSLSLLISLTLSFIFLYILPKSLYLAVFGLLTLYHVIGQQFGLNAAFAQNWSLSFKIWKWIGFSIASLASVLLFFPKQDIGQVYQYVLAFILFLLLLFIYFTFQCVKESKTKIGNYFFIANFFLIFFVFIFILFDYPFFAILLPRFIHDLSAFSFYCVHNKNRSQSKKLNLLGFNRFPIIMTIVISIVVAAVLNYIDFLLIILCLTLIHYCIEHFIWKGPTMHKKYILFKKCM